jgi:hypothetical protein
VSSRHARRLLGFGRWLAGWLAGWLDSSSILAALLAPFLDPLRPVIRPVIAIALVERETPSTLLAHGVTAGVGGPDVADVRVAVEGFGDFVAV